MLCRAPPPSAPRVRTPRAPCPQAAEPRQSLASGKTAQSCFEPLFLGTRGGFFPPPCKPPCLEERGDKGRGGQGTAEPTRSQCPQGSLSSPTAPGAGRQLGSSITPTAAGHPSPRPKPGSGPLVLTRASVLPSLPYDQAAGGAMRGPPLPSKEEEEEGSRVMNAISNPCMAATPTNGAEGLSSPAKAAGALPCCPWDAPRAVRGSAEPLCPWLCGGFSPSDPSGGISVAMCSPLPPPGLAGATRIPADPGEDSKAPWFGNGFHAQSE